MNDQKECPMCKISDDVLNKIKGDDDEISHIKKTSWAENKKQNKGLFGKLKNLFNK